jgi:hypothetical protein
MFTTLSGRIATCVVVSLLLFSLPHNAGAQSVDVFVGVRGGVTTSSSPIGLFQTHAFPERYTSTYTPTAWGPTVGVLIDDKIEIRAEAGRYPFHYTSQSGTPYPASGSKTTAVTDAHAWQFPVLVSYRVNFGTLRTFVGGGFSTRSIRGTVTATTTRIQLPNPTETTTVTTSAYDPGYSSVALNATVGFEIRKGWISFRPEMRLGFWTGYLGSGNYTLGSPTQAEFMLGIRMHPIKAIQNLR